MIYRRIFLQFWGYESRGTSFVSSMMDLLLFLLELMFLIVVLRHFLWWLVSFFPAFFFNFNFLFLGGVHSHQILPSCQDLILFFKNKKSKGKKKV